MKQEVTWVKPPDKKLKSYSHCAVPTLKLAGNNTQLYIGKFNTYMISTNHNAKTESFFTEIN